MIINKLYEIASPSIFYKLEDFYRLKNVYIKLEGLNIASSIKLKTALHLINSLELTQGISPIKNTIIESSSGNLGIALSIVCKSKGYKFICVTDPNLSLQAQEYIKLYGGQLIKINRKDKNGGYLGTRIDLIKKLIKKDPTLIWTNQYSSLFNIDAHYKTTAQEIYQQFPNLDYLFIGAGTTGTLVGCAKYFKKYSPLTKIIAVDAKGSVTFGFKSSTRYIPGIGMSRRPDIFSPDNIYDIILVDETNTIEMCHYMLQKYGLLLGGSSGSVMYAIKEYTQKLTCKNSSIVVISADFGDKYIPTLYDNLWIHSKYHKEKQ